MSNSDMVELLRVRDRLLFLCGRCNLANFAGINFCCEWSHKMFERYFLGRLA